MFQADWFIKCDDDTYLIVENLRYFLSNENPTDPVCVMTSFSCSLCSRLTGLLSVMMTLT